jgi:hypothetical protein
METHFRYEEKKLIAALNALEVPGWRTDRPDFLRTGADTDDDTDDDGGTG